MRSQILNNTTVPCLRGRAKHCCHAAMVTVTMHRIMFTECLAYHKPATLGDWTKWIKLVCVCVCVLAFQVHFNWQSAELFYVSVFDELFKLMLILCKDALWIWHTHLCLTEEPNIITTQQHFWVWSSSVLRLPDICCCMFSNLLQMLFCSKWI